MADPSTEYAKNMTKNSSTFDPDMKTMEQKKRSKKAKVKSHKFNQPKPKDKGTKHGSYFGKASKSGRAYLKSLDEAGKI